MSELIDMLNTNYAIISKYELETLRDLQKKAEQKRLSRKELSHKWFVENKQKHRDYCREKAQETYKDPQKRAIIRAYQIEYQKNNKDRIKLKKESMTDEQKEKQALYYKNYRLAQKQKLIDQAERLAELEQQLVNKSKSSKKSIVI